MVDDLLPKLFKAKVYTVCDAQNGYWQVELDDESRKSTTMATRLGRYRWKRMPFWISPAPEIFHEKPNYIIKWLEGVRVVCDDILVEGETVEQAERNHDE